MNNKMSVVTTSIGAADIFGTADCLFIKNTAEDFAEEILKVYDDLNLLSSIFIKQTEIVSKYYTKDAFINVIKDEFNLKI